MPTSKKGRFRIPNESPFSKDIPYWLLKRFVDWADHVEILYNEKSGIWSKRDILNNTAVLISFMGTAGVITNRIDDKRLSDVELSKREFGIEWTADFLNVTIDCPVTGKHVAKAGVKKAEVGDDDKADYINAAKKAVAYFCGCARAKFFMGRFSWASDHIDTESLSAKTWVDAKESEKGPEKAPEPSAPSEHI